MQTLLHCRKTIKGEKKTPNSFTKQLTQQRSSRKLNSDYRLFFYLFASSNLIFAWEKFPVSSPEQRYFYSPWCVAWHSCVYCPAWFPRRPANDWDLGDGPIWLLLWSELQTQTCAYLIIEAGERRNSPEFFFPQQECHIFIKSLFVLRTKHRQVTFCLQRASYPEGGPGLSTLRSCF